MTKTAPTPRKKKIPAKLPARQAIPSPDAFKAWLNRCIFELGTDPVKVSRRAEVGQNTTGSFLRQSRDIRMSVAIKLHDAVISMAREAGKPLPSFEEVKSDA